MLYRNANVPEKMYFDEDMNIYSNMLTPPSSTEDSSYMSSPQSGSTSPQMVYCEGGYGEMMTIEDQTTPCLLITEQPVQKFRFRYKSEMSGTHGSLTGMTSDKTRKQTYPTVELRNYTGPAIIRCTLYQHNSSNMYMSQPHAHRLIKKHGNTEVDDPHSINVSEYEGYRATFHSMGIIHTAKKYIASELLRKKTLFKKEEIARKTSQIRELTLTEERELKAQAEAESKSINLNIVCLRFDAYKEVDGILNPICQPVYSNAINNLKSALTGELKIVRMDRCSSPANGNQEVFILVEKVTKKNIKIRFFELDDDENEVWYAYGKFSDLDVHHQYAIVFRTPAYKDTELQEHRNVYIELERPSDGARSEPKDFKYIPASAHRTGLKRPRTSDSYSYSSTDYSSNELPATLPTYYNQSDDIGRLVDSGDLNNIIQNMALEGELSQVDPGALEPLFQMFQEPSFMNIFTDTSTGDTHKIDGPISEKMDWMSSKIKTGHSKRIINNKDDLRIMKEVSTELLSFIKTAPKKQRTMEYMKHIFENYVNSENSNILHLAIYYNDIRIFELILKIIVFTDMYELLNICNANDESPLHVAVDAENEKFVLYLIYAKANCGLKDEKGNTPIHQAVIKKSLPILRQLLEHGRNMENIINQHNNDGHTALHLAVKMNLLPLVKILCEKGADINEFEQKSGRTCLHLAIADQAVQILQYLLQRKKIDVTKVDYSNNTPLIFAKALITPAKKVTNEIYELLLNDLASKGLLQENDLKIEEDDENKDNFMESEKLFIKTETTQDSYCGVTEFSNDVLVKVSNLLDSSGNYEHLAQLLDLEHLLDAKILDGPSPSKLLLEYAVRKNDVSIWDIRNFLEILEEYAAVNILDQMASEKV